MFKISKEFLIALGISLVLIFPLVFAVPGVSHTPDEINPGTFGGDVSSVYVFPGKVKGTGICIGEVCKTTWPTGLDSGVITILDGKVGIGTTTPVTELNVVGNKGIQWGDGSITWRLGRWTDDLANTDWVYFTSGSGGAYQNLAVGNLWSSTRIYAVGELYMRGPIFNNFDGSDYDIWIQGRDGDTAGGDARNLAILGDTNNDRLIINHNNEYDGGTVIESDLKVTGEINGKFAQTDCTWTADLNAANCPAGYYAVGFDCTPDCQYSGMKLKCCRN